MKQFDWDKYPDIDEVAWNKDGKCTGYGLLESVENVWYVSSFFQLKEYDIDPTTEGFDWAQSKQIRPAPYLANIIEKQKELFLEYEKEKHDLKDRIAELEKELNIYKEKGVSTEARTKELEGEVSHYRRLALLKNTNHNEKLIDFWKERYVYYVELSNPYASTKAHEETELFKQAIERIENADR